MLPNAQLHGLDGVTQWYCDFRRAHHVRLSAKRSIETVIYMIVIRNSVF
jgi:hypothetical protein